MFKHKKKNIIRIFHLKLNIIACKDKSKTNLLTKKYFIKKKKIWRKDEIYMKQELNNQQESIRWDFEIKLKGYVGCYLFCILSYGR